jgi:hypothetical protein
MARTARYLLRISTEEQAQMQGDAATFGEPVSQWIRRCLRVARASLLPSAVAPSENGAKGGGRSGQKSGFPKGRRKKVKNGQKEVRTSRAR